MSSNTLKTKIITILLTALFAASPIAAVDINFYGYVAHSGVITKEEVKDENTLSIEGTSNYDRGISLTIDLYSRDGMTSDSGISVDHSNGDVKLQLTDSPSKQSQTVKYNRGEWSMDLENEGPKTETLRVTVAESE